MNWIKEKFGEIPSGVNYEQNILQVLSDTSLVLCGWKKAAIKHYFGIVCDPSFLKTDFDEKTQMGSIVKPKWLEKRVYSGKPIYLEDVVEVIERQIERTST